MRVVQRRRRHADQALRHRDRRAGQRRARGSSSTTDADGEPLHRGRRAAAGRRPRPRSILVRMEPDDITPAHGPRELGASTASSATPRSAPTSGCPISLYEQQHPPPALPVPPVDLRPGRQRQGDLRPGRPAAAAAAASPWTTRATWSPRATSPNPSARASGSEADHEPSTPARSRAPTAATAGDRHEAEQGRRRGRRGPTTASAWPRWRKKQLRKVFPDHWSFMLGEIALWSFVVLLLTGVVPDAVVQARAWARSIYDGSYDQLRGVPMSEAYASTLHISFDVRGGLLMRQMHHWAAMLFVAAMMVHLMRVFFTGAFRKPRELNWVIGCLLLLLGTLEGFTGYSLPDDLLSGTGLRAADGFMKSIAGGRHLHVVLPLRRRVPGRRDHPAALHRARAADPRPPAGPDRRPHAAARLPQAHPVARPRPHRAERRRLPDAAGLHRQGRRVLLHRLRRHRADGRPAVDQPGVEVRPLRPVAR